MFIKYEQISDINSVMQIIRYGEWQRLHGVCMTSGAANIMTTSEHRLRFSAIHLCKGDGHGLFSYIVLTCFLFPVKVLTKNIILCTSYTEHLVYIGFRS
jgi:hypothetical protein